MEHSAIRKKQSKTYTLLNLKRLKEALDMLREVVKDTHKSELIDTHYNIEMTYKSLLHYTVEGFTDPERQKIYNHLVADIFKLADDIFLTLFTRYGQGPFCELRRKYESVPASLFTDTLAACFAELDKRALMHEEELPISEILNEGYQTLFSLLLTDEKVYKFADDTNTLFSDKGLPWDRQCVMVSAITIHLMHYFNIKAVELLFDLTGHANPEVKQRALTGLLLVLYNYDKRLHLYPSALQKLEALKSNSKEIHILQSIIIQLTRTRETEKLARKLTDEILPEVARIHPNLRNRLDLDNILGESFQEGKNPDWENILSDSPELMGKLEEFSKLQMEGADLFLSTFRMLKHFSFFNLIDNWFLPFSYPSPIVNDILKHESGPFRNPDLLKGMAESGILCNSDKYSLILSIPQMPSAQKEMMGQMFLAELGAIREIEKSDELIQHEKQALAISNQYIQDLYRFFRVHRQRHSFEDPFSWKMDFHNRWFIQFLFPGDDLLLKLGEYLFEKDRYAEALEVFNQLAKKSTPSMQILQKQAFCYQQLQQHEQALELYLQADLFNHGQLWNLKKIALCYRHLKNPEKALEYYLEAERVAPDNLHTQVSIGHCLLETKNFTDALKYYFKVEYLDPSNKKVWRPIVWCALALGKFDQAEKYCQKLLNDNPNQHDFMNMGHVKWCEGKRQEALNWYQKSVTHPGHSIKEFLDAFENDRQILIQHHVDETDIPIMMDQLRYYLNNL